MKILITGITGTIGEAFSDHLLRLGHEVAGIDHNEERVAAFKTKHPAVDVVLGEFDDANLIGIDLLIHLAAFKHIDLCEKSVNACVTNNVIRTHKLFQRARDTNTKILFMSTDKAVEPNSMYGFSKALGEGMAREYGGAFIRSGNVVGSNGSVFGLWRKAIENSEPIKITHKDMHRFFISPENLVKRAWELYSSGETEITPKMDYDSSLLDIASGILSEFGYSIESYKPSIEFVGLRPGEKLREKLKWEN